MFFRNTGADADLSGRVSVSLDAVESLPIDPEHGEVLGVLIGVAQDIDILVLEGVKMLQGILPPHAVFNTLRDATTADWKPGPTHAGCQSLRRSARM